jgi:rabenosyn-5
MGTCSVWTALSLLISRGTWCRVCETCYKTREGYNDTEGASRDHSSSFIQTRQKVVDRTYLEMNRLETRLKKVILLQAYLTIASRDNG